MRPGRSSLKALPPPDVHDFIVRHPYGVGFAACWVLAALAESMPKPEPSYSPFYVWMFRFMHLSAGAIPRLIALSFPPQYARLFNLSMQVDESSALPKPNPSQEEKK